MSDPIRVPSLEGIPEPLHAHFTPIKEGDAELYEYRPPVPSTKTAEDVVKLNNALRKEREQRAQFEKQLTETRQRWTLEDGTELDPEEVRTWAEERRTKASTEMISLADAEAKFEERKSKAIAAAKRTLEQELATTKAALAEQNEHLEKHLIVDGIRTAVKDATLNLGLIDKADEVLIKIAKADKSIRVIDGKAVPFDGDQPAPDLSVVDWVSREAQRYGLVKESQGVGAQQSTPGAPNGHTRLRKSQMTPKQASEYSEKYGGRDRLVSNVPCYVELPR